VAAAVSWMRL